MSTKTTVDVLPISVAAQLSNQDVAQSFSSGFQCIDNCIKGGFREGDFTIISGIPGEGKTTVARMLTLNFAKQDIASVWFSHEMTTVELWDSFQEMGADETLLSYVPIELDADMDWMFRHIQKAVDDYNVKVVFIDTLRDVVRAVKNKQEVQNYSLYIEQLCKDLRDYAIKNKIMIFAIAHATKQTRSNSNETTNADIAYSNGIPATATNILHVWRDKESDNRSFVKIGKSRRDGTKKDWKFAFKYDKHRLIPEGRHLEDMEDTWRSL